MQVTLCNRCPSRPLQSARLPSWTQQQGMAPLVPRTCTGAHLGTARRWLRGRVRSSRMQSAEDFPSWAAAAASALRHQPALRPQARCQQAAREKCLRAGRKGGLGPRGQGQRSRRRAEEVSVGISSLLSQVCPPTLRFSFGFAGRAALPGCKMLRARSSCTSPALPSAGHGSGSCLHATPSCTLPAPASPCLQLPPLILLLAADNPRSLTWGRVRLGLAEAWDGDWAITADLSAAQKSHTSCGIQSEAKRCPLSSHTQSSCSFSFSYPAAAGLPSENLPKCLSCFLFCFAQVVVERLCAFKYKERPNLSVICF